MTNIIKMSQKGNYLRYFNAVKNGCEYLTQPRIGENVKIGKNVKFIGNFCYLGNNIILGDNVSIGFGTYIGNDCKVGSNTTIEHNTILADNTRIGSWTRIGSLCSSQGNAVIGNFVRINNQSQIGAGMVLEDRIFIGPRFVPSNTRNIQFGGRTHSAVITPSRIKFGARIGSGVTILPNVSIGRESFVGAGSVVTKDVPDFTIVYGNPAKVSREVPVEDRLPDNLYTDYIRRKKAMDTGSFGYKWAILGSLNTIIRRIVAI